MNLAELANAATIVASVIAAIALIAGLHQFNKTQRFTRENLQLQAESLQHEREIKAIDLFLRFNEVQQELTITAPSKENGTTFWRHNALLAITESVFRLTAGDAGWEETVLWMLQTQRPFLIQNPISSKTYDSKFVDFMKKAVPEIHCQ